MCSLINDKSSSLRSFVDNLDKKTPDKIALYTCENNSSYTFSEVKQQVQTLASSLLKKGLRPSDQVLLFGNNCIDWPVIYLAVTYVGGVIVPMDIAFKEEDIKQTLGHLDIKFIFCSESIISYFDTIPASKSISKIVFDQKNDRPLGEGQSSLHDLYDEEIAYALLSKRKPKGESLAALVKMENDIFVQLSHRNITYNIIDTGEGIHDMGKYLEEDDKWLVPIPLHHVYPTIFCFVSLNFGIPVVLSTRTNINHLIKNINRHKITYVITVPIILENFQNVLKKNEVNCDSVKFFMTGGGPIRRSSIDDMLKLGHEVLQGYGLTESAPSVSCCSLDRNRYGSSGKVLARMEIRIDEPDERGTGEIWLKGPRISKGYYNNQNLNREKYIDGWFRTGDFGRLDEDGFLTLTGRKKNIIVTNGGKNIYPSELESIYGALPEVRCIKVFPHMTSDKGELPLAFIQPDRDYVFNKNRQLKEEELPSFMKKILQAHAKGYSMHKKLGPIELVGPEENLSDYKFLPYSYEGFMLHGKSESEIITVQRANGNEENENEPLHYTGEQVKKYLVELIGKVNEECTDIEDGAGLFEYLDSMDLVAVADLLKQGTQIEIDATVLFEFPSLQALSDHLYQTYYDNFEPIAKERNWTKPRSISPNMEPKVSKNRLLPKEKPQNPEESTHAIIGMAGLFPGAGNMQDFWGLMMNGDNCSTAFPKDRTSLFASATHDSKELEQYRGNFIDGIGHFDAGFFGISEREASFMDPQQRMTLQVVHAAIEDAGYTREDLRGQRVGVFVGASTWDYHVLGVNYGVAGDVYMGTGIAHSILANRISYLFDFNGPSETVDTACSSSLYALGHALSAMERGDCDMAIVAGANVLVTANHFENFYQAGMLSPDGACKTFDARANGYVRGEGCGAIVIKPMVKAAQDHDNIHAQVLGLATNHGGKAASLTAPNPKAQSELIKTALKNAGISAEEISYIEAHGTGTSLGDPIEINGLKKALLSGTDENHSVSNLCYIGSVKTNIGHLEAAAGIAGIIKTILSFQNKKIPKLANFRSPNELIDLKGTPLKIADDHYDWEPPIINGRSVPRTAGVSSFGFGGANGHVILRESPSIPTTEKEVGQAYLFLLSAKSKAALSHYIRDFKLFLDNAPADLDLECMAYTLQLGRAHHAYRLAIVHDSSALLSEQLGFALKEKKSDGIYFGNTEAISKETSFLNFFEDGLGQEFLNKVMVQKQLDKLAILWCQNQEINWKKLYERLPGKMSLPTYPFEKQYLWIENKVQPQGPTHAATTRSYDNIAPLIHKNTSDFYFQKFLTHVDSSAPEIAGHQISGHLVVPGAYYVEMAIEAAELATGEKGCYQISNLELMGLCLANTETELETTLIPKGQRIDFFIRDQFQDLAQGHIEIEAASEVPLGKVGDDKFSETPKVMDQDEVYEGFLQLGLQYGHHFKSIYQLKTDGLLVVGRVKSAQKDKESQQIVPPQALDAAFQCCLALLPEDREAKSRLLPHRIKKIQVHAPLRGDFDVSVQKTAHELVFDIQVIDDDKRLILELEGFELKKSQVPENHSEIAYLTEEYVPFTVQEDGRKVLADREMHLISRPGRKGFVSTDISQRARHWSCSTAFKTGVSLPMSGEIAVFWDIDAIEKHMYLYREILSLAQFIKKKKTGETKVRLLLIGGRQQNSEMLTALSGFGMSLYREDPSFLMQVIDREEEVFSPSGLLASRDKQPFLLRQRQGAWQVRKLQTMEMNEASKVCPLLSDKDVVLITGGSGGLGHIMALHYSHLGLRVILIGRKSRAQVSFDQPNIHYFSCDVTDRTALKSLKKQLENENMMPTCIFHAAGVIKDSLLAKKTQEDFDQVLAGKVEGARALEEIMVTENLKYLVFFSSVVGALGNVGQTDYALANRYLDAYAGTLNQQSKERGDTTVYISINWPFWEEGGMKLTDQGKEWSKETLGILPLEQSEGLRALDNLLAVASQEMSNILVVKGLPGFREKLGQFENATYTTVDKVNGKALPNDGSLNQMAEDYLLDLFKKNIATRVKLHAGTTFDTLDIDSIVITNLNQLLAKDFGKLPKTLFFEHQSVKSLAAYLVKKKVEFFRPSPAVEDSMALPSSPLLEKNRAKSSSRFSEHGKPTNSSGDIAVIGLAGKYPMAKNIYELWENLMQAKDCTSEVPKDRWSIGEQPRPSNPTVKEGQLRYGAFIDDYDHFDPLFFNISPAEAETMDPQERLFLQVAYNTFRDGGYTQQQLNGKDIGVFVGNMYGLYQLHAAQAFERGTFEVAHSSYSAIANRVSYFFNLNGPSMAVDTMCSSSITSLHLACQSLMNGECSMALAGGVNLNSHPYKHTYLANSGFLAEDGKCRSFGQGGTGYVPGEGVGAVLLKPLGAAVAAGDNIWGVIKSTHLNHGGKTNGFTVPNPVKQSKLILDNLKRANIDATDLSYIETHGTGTSLGDPIEISGLCSSVGSTVTEDFSCPIGSVKSNIGHLESAAGIAALTKVLLQLRFEKLVPSLHASQVNPNISFEDTPFFVQQEIKPWEQRSGKRLAAVSAFGAGGSNAHVLIQDHPRPTIDSEPKMLLFPFSVKKKGDLEQELNMFVRYMESYLLIKSREEWSLLESAAYTLQTGRDTFEQRAIFKASSWKELKEQLALFVPERPGLNHQETTVEVSPEQQSSWFRDKQWHSLMEAWLEGAPIDWEIPYGHKHRPLKISLPEYRFMGKRYWIANNPVQTAPDTKQTNRGEPLFDGHESNPRYTTLVKNIGSQDDFWWQYHMDNYPLLTGWAFLPWAIEAIRYTAPQKHHCLSHLKCAKPSILETFGFPLKIQCILDRNSSAISCSLKTHDSSLAIPNLKSAYRSMDDDRWARHGNVLPSSAVFENVGEAVWAAMDLDHESKLAAYQMEDSGTFTVKLKDGVLQDSRRMFYLWEAIKQTLLLRALLMEDRNTLAHLPVSIGEFHMSSQLYEVDKILCRNEGNDFDTSQNLNLYLLDKNQRILASIKNFVVALQYQVDELVPVN